MAKNTGFAAKLAKGAGDRSLRVCDKCGQNITSVKHVASEQTSLKNAWKFKQRILDVCKCNEAEVYG